MGRERFDSVAGVLAASAAQRRGRSISTPTLAASGMTSNFLDANPGVDHAGVVQTHGGDALRQGSTKLMCPAAMIALIACDDGLVAHNLVQPVRGGRLAFGDGEIDIDAHRLAVGAFVGVNRRSWR